MERSMKALRACLFVGVTREHGLIAENGFTAHCLALKVRGTSSQAMNNNILFTGHYMEILNHAAFSLIP